MQKRIIFLLFLNVGVILVSLGIISHLSVTASIERSLENRLTLANIIGRYVDYVIESNVKRLYDVSLSGKVDLEDNDWEPERKALKTAMEYSIFTGRIFLLDRQGRVLLSYPHREEEGVDTFSLPYVRKVTADLKPAITDVHTLPTTKRSMVLALVPMKNKDGEVVGVVGGEIDPTNYMLSQFIAAIPAGSDTIIELVDSQGVIIASNDPRRILTCGDRYRFLKGLVTERKGSVQSCHRCKEGAPKSGREQDMLAFAPLSMAPWGVIVRDPQESVFSPSSSLRRGFLLLSAVAIVTTLLLALGLSKGIVRPVRSLIEATRRIASGNLNDPIEVQAKDEIGTLGKSFDDMRIKLAESPRASRRTARTGKHGGGPHAGAASEPGEARRAPAGDHHGGGGREEADRPGAPRRHEPVAQRGAHLAGFGRGALSGVRPDPQAAAPDAGAVHGDAEGGPPDDQGPAPADPGRPGTGIAIKWVLKSYRGTRDPVRLESAGAAEQKARARVEVDTGLELVLFRIAQEGIINVSKHAEAENVEVILAFGESAIDMEIRDDGKGFDAESVYGAFRKDHQVGLGLVGMGERISLLDGTLEVRSEPGRGTRISVHVPVPS
jgi:HAMP domain-containing protein/anti-sigma regulatory factor (Ser/Thr protein kinase)